MIGASSDDEAERKADCEDVAAPGAALSAPRARQRPTNAGPSGSGHLVPEEPRWHGKLQGKASQPGSTRAAKCTSGGDESLRDTDEQASAMAEHSPGFHVQADLQQMDLAAAPGGRVLVPAVAKSGGGVKAQGAGKARRHKPLSRLQRIEAEVQAKKVRRCMGDDSSAACRGVHCNMILGG